MQISGEGNEVFLVTISGIVYVPLCMCVCIGMTVSTNRAATSELLLYHISNPHDVSAPGLAGLCSLLTVICFQNT
jgi:hypothetical protein